MLLIWLALFSIVCAFWAIPLTLYFAAPLNGMIMTVYQFQFLFTFSEEKFPSLFYNLIIIQATLRLVNIVFFLINSYFGKPVLSEA
jgi:hypothetical protein